jgi:hypothetical protein
MTAFLSAGPCAAVVISRSDRPFGTARQDGNARVVARQRLNAKARASGLRRISDFAVELDSHGSVHFYRNITKFVSNIDCAALLAQSELAICRAAGI